uniref:UBX domain-containing protein n=1 Tax=Bursaphelenchus xylophilus TaxID=6326 RepID=A0A1I7S733_BURXY
MSKKTKKKQKLQEVDEDVLLRTAIQEAHSQRIASGSSFLGSNDDLFKPNLRQMDAEAEIREKLSQSMMKAKTTKGHNASIKPIFKIKRNWPPFKTLGISFKMVKEDGAVKTFQAVHSPAYANLNLLFTSFRQVHDLDSITVSDLIKLNNIFSM